MSNILKLFAFLAFCGSAAHAVAGDVGRTLANPGLANPAYVPSLEDAFVTPLANPSLYGLAPGYGWKLGGAVMLGMDGNSGFGAEALAPAWQRYTGSTYGLGFKVLVPLPLEGLTPYARLGYAHTQGSGAYLGQNLGSANGGLGLTYQIAPYLNLAGELSSSTTYPTQNTGGLKLRTNSLNIGVNFQFGGAPASGATPSSR